MKFKYFEVVGSLTHKSQIRGSITLECYYENPTKEYETDHIIDDKLNIFTEHYSLTPESELTIYIYEDRICVCSNIKINKLEEFIVIQEPTKKAILKALKVQKQIKWECGPAENLCVTRWGQAGPDCIDVAA